MITPRFWLWLAVFCFVMAILSGCETMPTVEGCERMVFATQEARDQCFDAAHEREDRKIRRTDNLLRWLNGCIYAGGVIQQTVHAGDVRLKTPRHGSPFTRKHISQGHRRTDFRCIDPMRIFQESTRL